jgi:arabinofuranosyltransferase
VTPSSDSAAPPVPRLGADDPSARPPRPSPSRIARLGPLVLILAAFLLHAAVYYRYTQDDTFISLRYAENLARGQGLVFNPGERVEGYSNFLYVLLLAGGAAAGLSLVTLAKVVGILSAAGVLVLVLGLPRRMAAEEGVVGYLAPALLALSPAFALWAVMGLETLFYTLLVLLAVTLFLEERGRPWRAVASGVAFAAVALTRPEGALFLVATMAWRALEWRRWGRRPELADLARGGVFAVCFGAFLLWRVAYYGDLLPNTYYAKAGFGVLGKLRGAKYLFEFLRYHGGAILPVLALAPLVRRRVPRWIGYLATLLAAHLAFVVWVGGDNMAQFRFMVPVLPLLYLLAQEGVRLLPGLVRGGEPGESWSPGRAAWVGAGAFLLLTAELASYTVYRYLPSFRDVAANDPISDSRDLVEMGRWLRRAAPGQHTIAVSEAGAIPYMTGWRTLDAFGLLDPVIARAPRVRDARGVPKKDPEVVVRRVLDWNPEFVELYTRPGYDTVLGPNDDLLWNALLHRGYVPLPPYDRRPGTVILARRDVLESLRP